MLNGCVNTGSGEKWKAYPSKITECLCRPLLAIRNIKLVGSTGCVDDPKALVLPLYFASKVTQLA